MRTATIVRSRACCALATVSANSGSSRRALAGTNSRASPIPTRPFSDVSSVIWKVAVTA